MVIIREEIIKAREGWDLNQERIFLENLLQQRFNFFVVAFSLVIASGTAAGSLSELNFVLGVGFIFSALLGFSVYRIFVKVDTVLWLMHQDPQSCMHKVAYVAALKKKWPLLFRVNDILGYVIPIFCLVVIGIWAILANSSIINVK